MRSARWVSSDTWELLRAGIASQLRRWPFDKVWDEVSLREAAAGENGQFVQLRRAGEDLFQAGFDPSRSLGGRFTQGR
jgi:hypothetical protein